MKKIKGIPDTNKTLCINLFGGPGTGKSTTAAGVFNKLKTYEINCELITEYTKSKVWEESFKTLENQLYLLGKQSHRQFVCRDNVECMVTDAPLLMMNYYGKDLSDAYHTVVEETFDEYNNLNFFLVRGDRAYNPAGRTQTEEEARAIDDEIFKLLSDRFVHVCRTNDIGFIVTKVVEALSYYE